MTAFVMLLALDLFADYTFELKLDHPDGVYKKGEKVRCNVSLLENGKPTAGRTVRYQYFNDFKRPVKTGTFISSAEPQTLELPAANRPAWRCFRVTLLDETGKVESDQKKHPVQKDIGAVTMPEGFVQSVPEPEDFDKFWDTVKAELSAIPCEAAFTEIPLTGHRGRKVAVYDVQVKSTGGIPVSGYLAVPKKAGKGGCPAIVTFQGAGVSSADRETAIRFALQGALAFSINAHGLPNGKPREYYRGLRDSVYYCTQPDGSSRYALRGIRNRNQYYFKGMYQRVMRALEYVRTRPEWNRKDLIVFGNSQGGAQAIAGAALDPKVTLLVAGVPALCDLGAACGNPPRLSGWPLNMPDKTGDSKDAVILSQSAYFDSANFAKRIQCESYLAAGLTDNVCSPCGVYVVFRNLAAKEKSLRIDPAGGHGTSCPDGNRRIAEILTGEPNS